MEHESDGDSNSKWCPWYTHQRINKVIGGLGNKMTIGNHPNYSIVKIGQNTEKSPRDLMRFVVTQTQEKDHQLKLM